MFPEVVLGIGGPDVFPRWSTVSEQNISNTEGNTPGEPKEQLSETSGTHTGNIRNTQGKHKDHMRNQSANQKG